MKKNHKNQIKEFINTIKEYNDFNKFVAENKEHFLGKHYLFTRNKKHNYKIMLSDRPAIFNYMIETNFKYNCSCVRYWCNSLDSYWKNEVLTVSKITDDGLVQFKGIDEWALSLHSLWVFDEVSEEFKNKFNSLDWDKREKLCITK